MAHRIDDRVIVRTIPFIHRQIDKDARELAEEKYQDLLASEAETLCFDGKVQYTPCALFPSQNFLSLLEIVKNHFEVSRLTTTNRTLGILIDGEPGLGKRPVLIFSPNLTFVDPWCG
jgi:hypothetical protein